MTKRIIPDTLHHQPLSLVRFKIMHQASNLLNQMMATTRCAKRLRFSSTLLMVRASIPFESPPPFTWSGSSVGQVIQQPTRKMLRKTFRYLK